MSKETPPSSNNETEGSTYVFRLDVPKLLAAAAARGDDTRAKIWRRTGISESSVYRILNGETQPDLNSAMRLAETYDLDLRTVIKRVYVEAAA